MNDVSNYCNRVCRKTHKKTPYVSETNSFLRSSVILDLHLCLSVCSFTTSDCPGGEEIIEVVIGDVYYPNFGRLLTSTFLLFGISCESSFVVDAYNFTD